MRVTAVLLDLDGLIADTEPIHIEALRAAAASFGVTLADDYITAKLVGASDEQNAIDIAADLAPTVQPAALLARKEREFIAIASARRVSPRPGLSDLIACLRARGVRLAVVSSSKAEAVEIVLARLAHAQGPDSFVGCFDVIVTGSEVAALKPAPELYLRACDALAVQPGHCLAVEDSAAGVQAARAAGIRCIAVPNELTRSQDLAGAWRVCRSLAEIASVVEPLLPAARARE